MKDINNPPTTPRPKMNPAPQKPRTGNGQLFNAERALEALETIKKMGTEQEQRETVEYLQRVLHEYQ